MRFAFSKCPWGHGVAGKTGAVFLFLAMSHLCQAQDQFFSTKDGFTTINRLVDLIESDYIEEIKEDALLAPCLASLGAIVDTKTNAREVIRDTLAKLPKSDVGLAVELCGRGISSALNQSPPAFLGPNRVRPMLGVQPAGSVGLTVEVVRRGIFVHSSVENSPAAMAGIGRGDLLVEVDDRSVIGLSESEVNDALRGDVGTTVKVSVLQSKTGKKVDFSLNRAVVRVPPVRSKMLSDGVAYVVVGTFYPSEFQDFQSQLSRLRKANGKPLSGLILDMRLNSGGLLEVAAAHARLFLREEQVFVEQRRRNPALSKIMKIGDIPAQFKKSALDAELTDELRSLPVAVLVSEVTASGAEAFAAAFQSSGRGKVIGEKTAGVGVVQNLFPVSRLAMVAISTSGMFDPRGKAIQGVGITPDAIIQYPVDSFGFKSIRALLDNPLKDVEADLAVQSAITSFSK